MTGKTKPYYIIRTTPTVAPNHQNRFQSGEYELVAVVHDSFGISAVDQAETAGLVVRTTGQGVFSTSNPRSVSGLTAAIRQFSATSRTVGKAS